MSEKQCKRTAIYIAQSAYGEIVDLDEALASCKSSIRAHKELKLMRVYRDENVVVTGSTAGQTGTRKRGPLGAEGNDAWKRLLLDTETSAIEAVVIYAARTIAPSVTELETVVNEYFIPCGIRFIDVEAEFDTADGNVESYIKKKRSEYRSNLKRRSYQSYEKRGE